MSTKIADCGLPVALGNYCALCKVHFTCRPYYMIRQTQGVNMIDRREIEQAISKDLLPDDKDFVRSHDLGELMGKLESAMEEGPYFVEALLPPGEGDEIHKVERHDTAFPRLVDAMAVYESHWKSCPGCHEIRVVREDGDTLIVEAHYSVPSVIWASRQDEPG